MLRLHVSSLTIWKPPLVDEGSFRCSHRWCSVKKVLLKIFANFTGKHLCWSHFLIKLQVWRCATLLKRDTNTGALLWNLRNFYSTNNSFCHLLFAQYFSFSLFHSGDINSKVVEELVFKNLNLGSAWNQSSFGSNVVCMRYYCVVIPTLSYIQSRSQSLTLLDFSSELF